MIKLIIIIIIIYLPSLSSAEVSLSSGVSSLVGVSSSLSSLLGVSLLSEGVSSLAGVSSSEGFSPLVGASSSESEGVSSLAVPSFEGSVSLSLESSDSCLLLSLVDGSPSFSLSPSFSVSSSVGLSSFPVSSLLSPSVFFLPSSSSDPPNRLEKAFFNSETK